MRDLWWRCSVLLIYLFFVRVLVPKGYSYGRRLMLCYNRSSSTWLIHSSPLWFIYIRTYSCILWFLSHLPIVLLCSIWSSLLGWPIPLFLHYASTSIVISFIGPYISINKAFDYNSSYRFSFSVLDWQMVNGAIISMLVLSNACWGVGAITIGYSCAIFRLLIWHFFHFLTYPYASCAVPFHR